MSREDLAKKQGKLAIKIAKIELVNPEIMDYQSIKDELLMRLKDAELVYGANLIFNTSMAFSQAQRAINESDIHEGYKAIEPHIKELPNFENAERTKVLWLELIRRKDDPANGNLVVAPQQFELIEAEVVDEFGMSQEQLDRLNQLEFAIQKGIDSITAMGEALREIRDSGLYKRHGTFEEYCEDRWGFSRARAYQFIEAEKTVNNLLTSGIERENLPTNEAQARALASVPPEKQAEVWDKARSEGKPSAAKIKAIAGNRPIKDNRGRQAKIVASPLTEIETEWNPNLWETPTNIAKAIACLLNEDELKILEPCAGTGQIAKAIANIRDAVDWEYELTAIEIRKDRAKELEDNRYWSIDADFLDFQFGSDRFDAVVTNPPFDIGMEILERSLSLIKFDGRCLFLLPSTYFQTQERAKKFALLNAHIHKVYPIVGRVSYLKNGVPETSRQCEDSIFDIRLGVDCDGAAEFIWQ